MRCSTFVCIFVLLLAVGLTAGSPLSAQRVEARFSDLDVSQVEPDARPTAELSAIPGLRQVVDSAASASGPSLVAMTISSSLGSVVGSILGIMIAAGTEADPWNEGPEPYLAAATFGAVGSVPGSSLGAWIAGRNSGVGFGGALVGAFLGLGSGIALEAATGGATFPAAFVVGQGVTTALVARAFAD